MTKGLMVQITHIKEFYPKKINYEKAKNLGLIIDKELQSMTRTGRALENNLKFHTYRQSPGCFNSRSISKKANNLSDVLTLLYIHGKFCAPLINPIGEIKFGEMLSCHTVGTIKDKPKTIFENLRKMKCRKCGLYQNLNPLQLSAIED
jgi:hypothetical protein